MIFDSCMLTFEAANAGVGFAVANRAYIAPDILAGRLVAPFDVLHPNRNGRHLKQPSPARHPETPRCLPPGSPIRLSNPKGAFHLYANDPARRETDTAQSCHRAVAEANLKRLF